MILFPNCKINIGLNIVGKRADGYHDIETIMVPVGWTDVLEIVPGKSEDDRLFTSGRTIDCLPEKNLVMRAVKALREVREFPAVDVYLRKIIPDGAGLGGGSADASFTLKGVNELYGLRLSADELAAIAATLGADCPFFIYNRPMLATGTGTDFQPIDLDITRYNILIAKPGVSVPTKVAYSRVTPRVADYDLIAEARKPIEEWQGVIRNDFEPSVFAAYPEIALLKRQMMDAGAVYAAMSGSGATVFGIFDGDILADGERFGATDCYLTKEIADWQCF